LRRFGGPFRRAGFEFVPYQQALAHGVAMLPAAEFEREMKLRRADGHWFGGAQAWIEMCREVTWLKPLGWLGELPGIHHLLAWGYRRIAANRYCLARRCGTQRKNPS
jgi:predicted DCC family thiol-disulfide oxidoreductase YuxK